MPIKLENASKRAGNRWIYRDVSFEVADGEVFCIFGPNGSGRAEILSTLDGSIARKPSFFARLFGNASGKDSDDLAKLIERIDSATAYIILNDPFHGLDVYQRTEVAKHIRETASQKGHPIVISTFDFNDVLAVGDRAAVLNDGYIQQTATPRELYDEPVNRCVASLTGRVNLIEVRRLSSSKSGLPEFQTIAGEHRLFTQKVELRKLGAINKNAYLVIRPEQIVLSFGASFPEDNLLKAVIAGIEFYGPVTYVKLDCSGLELEAMVTRLVGLNIGDECMVGLPPDRIRVLAD